MDRNQVIHPLHEISKSPYVSFLKNLMQTPYCLTKKNNLLPVHQTYKKANEPAIMDIIHNNYLPAV